MDIDDDHFGIIEEHANEDHDHSQLSGIKRRIRAADKQ